MAQSETEPANSSSAEEEELSSEASESESEPDKTSTPPPSSKITKPTPNSSSDDSDDSESDTGKPPIPDPNIKPPTDHDQSKKPRSKNPTTRYSPPPLKSSTGKRPAAEAEVGPSDSKRIKKKTVVAVAAPDAENNNGFGEKKQLFQRLWSEENEIELIQGMINYVSEKGKDPVADVNDFHDFVKKSLHVDVSNKQVVAKVRRLKKKYKNNVARAEKQSKVRSFSNPHEKKMYELSKKLWGNDSNKNVVMSSTTKKVNVTPKVKKNGKSDVNGGVEVIPEAIPIDVEPKMVQPLRSVRAVEGLDHGSMGFMITDEVIMKKGLELLSGPKKVEMEEKWKNLKVQELKHFLKKIELLKEQAETVLNAMVQSGDN